jgi:hypothetical protein
MIKEYYKNKYSMTANPQNIEDKAKLRINQAPAMEINIEALKNKCRTNELR